MNYSLHRTVGRQGTRWAWAGFSTWLLPIRPPEPVRIILPEKPFLNLPAAARGLRDAPTRSVPPASRHLEVLATARLAYISPSIFVFVSPRPGTNETASRCVLGFITWK